MRGLTLAILLIVTGTALGQPLSAGVMTLKEYRALSSHAKTALMAGAMAATEHVGLRCPDPQFTVAEYVSVLTFRTLDEAKPWISHYFDLATAKGCRVEEDVLKEPTS